MKYRYVFIKDVFILLFCSFLFCSCNNTDKNKSYSVLKVPLKVDNVAMMDLFKRLEVIPLETKDSCLLICPDKVLYEDGYYEVFDSKHPALFVFNEDGKFVRQIGKKGNAPNEYTEIYDVTYDEEAGHICMLSPFGEIFIYALNGTFLSRMQLPQRANYQSFESFKNYFVTWTLSGKDEDAGISIISKRTMQCVKKYWKENRNLDFLYPRGFYKFRGKMYFFRPFGREVYQFDKNNMNIAYKWDFGKDNYSVEDFGFSKAESKGEQEGALLMKKLKDSSIPYLISNQAQSNKYYYTKLVFGFTPDGQYHVFYRKSDGKSFFFKETKEGIKLNPLLFCDEFMLCLASNADLNAYIRVLDEKENRKLIKRKEDDNPVLIKCYFK